ncbi:MAG TPA: helix-turn-helix domain-containing protein [Albitalea sp.]|uniref:MerR family transcriptional regulator n=1 Tax=Piscinibacter sp. TaxID=1903157 RepID=UPI002ED38882
MSATLSIGFVARQTGCTVPTIRYYEEIGLLPTAARSDAGKRHYDEGAVRRLVFIRRCRDFGFSIEQVRELVSLVDQPQRPCVEVRDIAATHLGEVRSKLAELHALEANLAGFVGSCNTACAGGATIDCTILDDLAQPSAVTRPVSSGACCGESTKSSEGALQ